MDDKTDPTLEIIEAHAEVVMQTSGAETPEEERQLHKTWLVERKKGIGGSDAAGALRLSRYQSPRSVWLDKTTEDVEDIDNEPMYWGRALEPAIVSALGDREGLPVRRFPYMIRSKKWPWMQVNLDGLTDMAVIEAKNVGLRMSDEWETEDGEALVPDHYNIQGQHACAVTGLPGVWFAVLIGGQDFRAIYVKRDDELISYLTSYLENFWQLVLNGTPPAVDGSEATKKALKRQFGTDVVPDPIEVDDTMLDWLRQRRAIKAQMKDLKEHLDSYENSIKAVLGHHEIGEYNGVPVVTAKLQVVKEHPVKEFTKRPLLIPKKAISVLENPASALMRGNNNG